MRCEVSWLTYLAPGFQMEYVEKLTLREAIEDGVSEIDSWRWIVSCPAQI